MTDRDVPQQPLFPLDALGRRQQPRWLAAAERRATARRAFEALTDDEKAAIYARIDRLLFTETRWRVARSVPENPHSYTHRRNFKQDDDFAFLIATFRAGGVIGCERQKFADRWYDTFLRTHPVTGTVCRFWCMGWPLNMSNGGWLTVIINRKPVLETDV
jgi:hypothetical protein